MLDVLRQMQQPKRDTELVSESSQKTPKWYSQNPCSIQLRMLNIKADTRLGAVWDVKVSTDVDVLTHLGGTTSLTEI